jgi:hypothetical protein
MVHILAMRRITTDFVGEIQQNGTRDPALWMKWRFATLFGDEHLQVDSYQ